MPGKSKETLWYCQTNRIAEALMLVNLLEDPWTSTIRKPCTISFMEMKGPREGPSLHIAQPQGLMFASYPGLGELGCSYLAM